MRRSKYKGRLALAVVASVAAYSATAQAHTKRPVSTRIETAVAPSGKPLLVGSYGDWGAYLSQAGKSKICYALAQPKNRDPSSLKKDQAYVFISNRPAEGVRNEISVIMGVPLKDGAAEAKAEVGTASFDLISKGQNAWIKNAADETRFIEALKRGSRLIVRGTLIKGGVATDSYSLSGLAQALDRVVKDCQ